MCFYKEEEEIKQIMIDSEKIYLLRKLRTEENMDQDCKGKIIGQNFRK